MIIEVIHIGFGKLLDLSKVIAIAPPKSAAIKRIISDGKNGTVLVDMTQGRKTKAAIFTDNGHIILSSFAAETIAGRSNTSTMSLIVIEKK
jgi:extracellular matrix regulatory protein A